MLILNALPKGMAPKVVRNGMKSELNFIYIQSCTCSNSCLLLINLSVRRLCIIILTYLYSRLSLIRSPLGPCSLAGIARKCNLILLLNHTQNVISGRNRVGSVSKFDISNQIRKNAIKLSHDSTSQRRLIVLDLCHFKNYASIVRQWLT